MCVCYLNFLLSDNGQLQNSNFLNNSDINITHDVQTEHNTSDLVQNKDTVIHSDNSLDDISFPARFTLRNIQEEGIIHV